MGRKDHQLNWPSPRPVYFFIAWQSKEVGWSKFCIFATKHCVVGWACAQIYEARSPKYWKGHMFRHQTVFLHIFRTFSFRCPKLLRKLHDWCCIMITDISNWHRKKIWQSSCEDMSIILWPHQDHLMCTHSNDNHGMSTSARNLYQDNRQFIVLAINCNQQAKIFTINWQ